MHGPLTLQGPFADLILPMHNEALEVFNIGELKLLKCTMYMRLKQMRGQSKAPESSRGTGYIFRGGKCLGHVAPHIKILVGGG